MNNRAVAAATKGLVGDYRHAYDLLVEFVYLDEKGVGIMHRARASIVLASWEIAEFLLTSPSRHDVEGERLRYELNTGVWSASLGGWCTPHMVVPSSVRWWK